MMKRLVIAVCAMMIAAVAANAQDHKVKWGLDMAGAFSGMYDDARVGSLGGMVDVGVVAMVMPQIGFRASLYGGPYKSPNANNMWKLGSGCYAHLGVSLDLLWDIITTFSKTHEGYQVQPYFRFANEMGLAHGQKAMSFALGAGVRQVFPVSKMVGFLFDLNAVVTKENSWRNTDGRMLFGQALAGVSLKF